MLLEPHDSSTCSLEVENDVILSGSIGGKGATGMVRTRMRLKHKEASLTYFWQGKKLERYNITELVVSGHYLWSYLILWKQKIIKGDFVLCIPVPFCLSVQMMKVTNVVVLTGVWKHRKSVSSVLPASFCLFTLLSSQIQYFPYIFYFIGLGEKAGQIINHLIFLAEQIWLWISPFDILDLRLLVYTI